MTEIHYHGRKWDAPVTDDAIKVDMTGLICVPCGEVIGPDDDGILNTWANQPHHLECYIGPIFGDVAHLEQRCRCFGGGDHDTEGTHREQMQRALQWLIDHKQGRFHD